VIRRAAVHGLPALVLAAPSSPQGGENGDHVTVAWNPQGHGAFVSLHLGGYAEPDRIAAALAVAASWR